MNYALAVAELRQLDGIDEFENWSSSLNQSAWDECMKPSWMLWAINRSQRPWVCELPTWDETREQFEDCISRLPNQVFRRGWVIPAACMWFASWTIFPAILWAFGPITGIGAMIGSSFGVALGMVGLAGMLSSRKRTRRAWCEAIRKVYPLAPGGAK